MNLIADKAILRINLRNACLLIAVSIITLSTVGLFMTKGQLPLFFSHKDTVIAVVFNLALLFGALLRNSWLVLPWLLYAVYFIINWLIETIRLFSDYDNYRKQGYIVLFYYILTALIVGLIVFLYCARLVVSFFVELMKPKDDVQVVPTVLT